jgi:anti-sigma factor ChrR (cupin superfamily)
VKVGGAFITLHTDGARWVDATALFGAPPGAELKLLRHDPADDDVRDCILRFPAGYTDPRHTHPAHHRAVVLEGTVEVGGEVLGPGDYLYTPRDAPHGPFHYPDGAMLFASFRGDPAQRPASDGEGHRPGALVTLKTGEMAWEGGYAETELPLGGPQVKRLRHDVEDGAIDVIARFEPGYVEPRHWHGCEHSVIALEGGTVVHDERLGRFDYLYAPRDEPHGPLKYLDGVVWCSFARGDMAAGDMVHHYEGKP